MRDSLLPHVAGPAALERRDHARANAFVDSVMRPEAPLSMAEDFPLLLGRGAAARRLVIMDDGEILAHAAARTHVLDLPDGATLRLLNIGAVCTAPAARSRGYAAALVSELMAEATGAGIELAILWSSRPDYYAWLGFRGAGFETQFRVDRAALDGGRAVAVRPYAPRDLPRLLELRRADPLPLRRTWADAQRLFALPRSTCLVAEAAGRPIAYAVLGKGLDFQNTIAEWGGPAECLPALLREHLLIHDLDELAIVGPGWHAGFAREFVSRSCPRHDGDVALLRVLDTERLSAALAPLTAPADRPAHPCATDLLALLGRPPGPAPIPFYIWGLDSV